MKKYKIVRVSEPHPYAPKTKNTYLRIEALRDIYNPSHALVILKGTLGGFIEKENNLSHEGGCWIYPGAKVKGNARVSGDAVIKERALVQDSAAVDGSCIVKGNACISGNARVGGNIILSGSCDISGNVQVSSLASFSISNLRLSKNDIIRSSKDFSILVWSGYTIIITPQNSYVGCQVFDRFKKYNPKTVAKESRMTLKSVKCYYNMVKFLENKVDKRKA